MPTNLSIGDRPLNQALSVGGYKTKRDTVNEAPREFMQRRKHVEIVRCFGKIEYDADYYYKKERHLRWSYLNLMLKNLYFYIKLFLREY